MEFKEIRNGEVTLRVAVEGSGPLLLCVHGWPELWYSWRHQIDHFATRGYTVAAMDVRGYGGSSKPEPIAAYSMRSLASDVAAVAESLGDGPVILLGHDWGAPIVWNTTLLYPELIRAVAGLSVPFSPPGEVAFLDIARQIYADRFFYQVYFQPEGVAEVEIEANLTTALRKIYFALSGDAEADSWLAAKPADAALLDGMTDPEPFPAWLSDADLQVFVDAFAAGGLRGPLNRYRAQHIDVEELSDVRGRHITQPACFIAGSKDAVRNFVPGADLYADPGASCDNFRGSTIIEGIGHWVQQEAPQETNAALEVFLQGL